MGKPKVRHNRTSTKGKVFPAGKGGTKQSKYSPAMKEFDVRIGYDVGFDITAKDKKEAEEQAWFAFDQSQPHEPEIEITEKKKKAK